MTKQTDLTLRFIEQVENLIKAGAVKDYTQVSNEIGYDKTSLSNIIKGRRNIPYEVYKLFSEKYNIVEREKGKKDLTLNYAEEIITLRAAVKILTLTVIELRHLVTKESSTKVSLELEKMMKDEARRLQDELK